MDVPRRFSELQVIKTLRFTLFISFVHPFEIEVVVDYMYLFGRGALVQGACRSSDELWVLIY